MESDVTVEVIQDINKLYSLMYQKDQKYKELFDKIVESTEDLEDDSITSKQKYNIIIAVEFLLVRLRFLLSNEQTQVKSFINNKATTPAWLQQFKARDVLLASYHQKLGEIREDVSILQKAMYTLNSFNFNK